MNKKERPLQTLSCGVKIRIIVIIRLIKRYFWHFRIGKIFPGRVWTGRRTRREDGGKIPLRLFYFSPFPFMISATVFNIKAYSTKFSEYPCRIWIGEKKPYSAPQGSPFRLLEPMQRFSCGEASNNLLVQGNNLNALKALLPHCTGRDKLDLY
jgi:hypothetical protein